MDFKRNNQAEPNCERTAVYCGHHQNEPSIQLLNLWSAEPKPAMTATEYEMPPEVVPPGDQTGIYYIPISSVCETLEDGDGTLKKT